MKKNLIVFGTRPEAIKMAPLVKEFKKNPNFETKVCVTAQHREMLDQVLDFFEIVPDYDLDLMKPNQTLSTSTVAALAAFYAGAKICHVEAGLRTHNKWSPFPEEMNRQLTGRIADYHFAPTQQSYDNLIREAIAPQNIIVTGNTVIDALFESTERVNTIENAEIEMLKELVRNDKKLVLVTGHRRENHGQGFINICEALKEIATINADVQIIYPVHLNPNVQKPVYEILKDVSNIHLINPLTYPAFVWLMNKSYLIVTDSGGVQEEAPSLGKPVLVMRDTTERPEAVEAGTVILVGTDKDKIVAEAHSLLTDDSRYASMSALHNPYGDGKACERIISFICGK
jgi:UDP-N-acetylglucosamine 2-epimerase (non-hydrolysing)